MHGLVLEGLFVVAICMSDGAWNVSPMVAVSVMWYQSGISHSCLGEGSVENLYAGMEGFYLTGAATSATAAVLCCHCCCCCC